MPRLLLPAVIVLSLAACSSPAAPVATPAAAAPAAVPSAPVQAGGVPVAMPAAAPVPESVPATAQGSAIEGAIHDGNRPPPALRICAHPLDGGKPTCTDTAAGATSYRIEVAAGRYVVAGQALGDPGMKFAHAERIRCIRAPCPPDTSRVVEVAPGAMTGGIDLTPGQALPPATDAG